MIGTAIRDRTSDLAAHASGLSRGRGRQRSSARYRSISQGVHSSARRLLLTALLLLSFVVGTVVCGPAAHPSFDGSPPQMAQAQNVQFAAATLAKHNIPAKGLAAGWCSGHCLSHSVSLPTPPVPMAAVSYVVRATWQINNDQWSEASSPARLERPPRV